MPRRLRAQWGVLVLVLLLVVHQAPLGKEGDTVLQRMYIGRSDKVKGRLSFERRPFEGRGPNVYGGHLSALLEVASHLLGLGDGRRDAGVSRRGKEGQDGQEGHAGQRGLESHDKRAVAAFTGGI